MVQHLDEGHAVIRAEKESGLPVQVGSQRASALSTWKAKELLNSGIIGELNMADIRYDRNNANGAWQYSIPTDASPVTIDWDRFIGDASNHDFDPVRFFRWRNYSDYGTGVAGDLFVHLFTALHIVTGSIGPERIYSTGGLRFWKDGRDVPDITLGLYDYPATAAHPAFNVQMRVNFVDGSGGGSHVRLIGSEGVMTLTWDGIHIKRSKVDTTPSYGGWDSYDTFSEAQQKDFQKWFKTNYPPIKASMSEPDDLKYTTPEGFNEHVEHWANFVDAIHNGTKLVEDATFGLRAAGPSLATNDSYYQRKIINWDAEKMRIV
jgi:predicted dehydrogenase